MKWKRRCCVNRLNSNYLYVTILSIFLVRRDIIISLWILINQLFQADLSWYGYSSSSEIWFFALVNHMEVLWLFWRKMISFRYSDIVWYTIVQKYFCVDSFTFILWRQFDHQCFNAIRILNWSCRSTTKLERFW